MNIPITDNAWRAKNKSRLTKVRTAWGFAKFTDEQLYAIVEKYRPRILWGKGTFKPDEVKDCKDKLLAAREACVRTQCYIDEAIKLFDTLYSFGKSKK